MAYGLKYTCDFDSNITSYTLEIHQKDYAGGVIPVTGSSTPVTHTWETDEPNPPIKGSSLAISLINDGAIPLSDLYSIDDEEFKAILIWHTGITDIVMFEGFIVQDDSSELMVDYNHEISIAANDNLGLLKDIPLDKSLGQPLYLVESITDSVDGQAPNFVLVSVTTYDKVDVGDTLVIASTGGVNGTFTVAKKEIITGSYYLTFKEAVANLPATSSTVGIYRPDMYTLRTLNSFIKSCLYSTGLLLQVMEFVNLNEVSQPDTDCFLDQTLLDPQTFNGSNSWDDCYKVLTTILERFDCTLFQAKGKWNIIRWPELRDFDYSIPGFLYDTDFTFLNTVELDEGTTGFSGWNKFLIGIGETCVAENGLLQRITRPYKFVKEKFDYRQPDQLLRNADLQQLGNLINTYTTGSGPTLQNINEYEALWWFNAVVPGTTLGTAVYFIRVISDNLGNELERYLVMLTTTPASFIQAFPIQANIGDGFKFSFTVRSTQSITGGVFGIAMLLIDGVQPYQQFVGGQQTGFPTVGEWQVTTNGWTAQLDATDNINTWHSLEIDGTKDTIPFDGLLYIGLVPSSTTAGYEMQYKDIRLEYITTVNQSTKIIGQTHTSEQDLNIKNKQERDILIDTTPRNSIQGTLFLSSLTGNVQARCGQWIRKTRTESKNLGEITTEETLFLRRLPRTILEGTFYGLISAPQTTAGPTIVNHISLLSVIQYTFFTDLNFIFGRLEIDYRNNSASGTLYELYKGIEVDSDLSYFYLFQYLYAAK